MLKKPSAIGEDEGKLKYSLIVEQTELPKSRPEIAAAIVRILDKGLVQEVSVKVGKPIRYSRLVPQESLHEGQEFPAELLEEHDLFSASRNAELKELAFSEKVGPYEYLFKAFHVLSRKGLKPLAFLVRDMDVVREWLGVDADYFDTNELFGVTVHPYRGLPKDAALLLGVSPEEADPNAVSLTVKLCLNVKVEEADHELEADREDSAGVGTGGEAPDRNDGAVGVLGSGGGGAGQGGQAPERNKGTAHKTGRRNRNGGGQGPNSP